VPPGQQGAHPGRIHDAVVAYLQARDWPLDDRGDVVATPVTGTFGEWPAFFEIREDAQQLLIYSVFPLTVPEERLDEGARFVTRANWGLTLGNFELDLDDGEIRYKTSADFEGADIPDAMVDHLFLANVITSDRYLPALRAVIDGADAASAVAAAEATGSA